MQFQITDEIKNLCQQLADLYADKLAQDNAIATGNLINHLNHVIIEDDGDGISVYFELPEYWKYAPEGKYGEEKTNPKLPPVEPLIQWAKAKGLPIPQDELPSFAWGLAHKILNEGWKNQPRMNLAETLANPTFNEICDKIEDAIISQVISDEIDALLNNL